MNQHTLSRSSLLLALLLLAVPFGGHAQKHWKNYATAEMPRANNYAVSFFGGLGGYLINSKFDGPTKTGFHLGGSVTYTYLLTPNFGVRCGAGVTLLSSGFNTDSVVTTSQAYDVATYDDGAGYTGPGVVQMKTTHIEEDYKSFILEIPLQAHYQNGSFAVNAGLNFMIPFNITSTYSYGETRFGLESIEQTGTAFPTPIPLNNSVPADDGHYTPYKIGGNEGFHFYVAFAFDIGYRISLQRSNHFYIGAYCNYALNQVNLNHDAPFLSYQGATVSHAEEHKFNSALLSEQVSDIRAVSFGLKVEYSLGMGTRRR